VSGNSGETKAEVLGHRREVAVVVQKLMVVLDAERGNYKIC
jgi:hypothetical protein